VEASGLSIEFLLRGYPVPHVEVEQELPGLANVRSLSDRRETSDGSEERSIMLVTCGGVSMSLDPAGRVEPSKDPILARVHEQLASAPLSPLHAPPGRAGIEAPPRPNYRLRWKSIPLNYSLSLISVLLRRRLTVLLYA
jgi:hypothetical protein